MKRILAMLLVALTALFIAGCGMRTVDEMYCLPKRSEEDSQLQQAIDQAMTDLDYSAPVSGEHQQSVQMADLDGDKKQEYLVFTKGTSERPLRVLVFKEKNDEFMLLDTIVNTGSAFDRVEYVQMDGKGGAEIVIGRQISNQLVRSVAVYTYTDQGFQQILNTNYQKFLTVDMDSDGISDLFIFRPGTAENDNGIAELYYMNGDGMERGNEMSMSGPVDKLKRIMVGKLNDHRVAVYAASSVDDNALITDVYALIDGKLKNISFSNESGTSVSTMRNYYVYAEDIDADGVVELPDLNTFVPLPGADLTQRYEMVRWYAMASDGTEVDKLYTYHNFIGGWYLELDPSLATHLTVNRKSGFEEFHIWDSSYQKTEKIFTIYTLTGKNRDEQVREGGYAVLLQTETVIYAVKVEDAALNVDMTEEKLIRNFHMIHQVWNTGEI